LPKEHGRASARERYLIRNPQKEEKKVDAGANSIVFNEMNADYMVGRKDGNGLQMPEE